MKVPICLFQCLCGAAAAAAAAAAPPAAVFAVMLCARVLRPGRVLTRAPPPRSGGCMWSFALLHASTSEYLMFSGAGVATSGHTGRHLCAFTDVVVRGEAWYATEHRPFEQVGAAERCACTAAVAAAAAAFY